MIILISGASHTGKTALAQRVLENYHIPYLSIDHLKMGLIRSGLLSLTPQQDEKLTGTLWPVVREIIRTAIENHQNLVVEGIYIPEGWHLDFSNQELEEIRYCCLIMTEDYIRSHLSDIRKYADIIEKRIDDTGWTPEELAADNRRNLEMCRTYHYPYILIDHTYDVNLELTPPGNTAKALLWETVEQMFQNARSRKEEEPILEIVTDTHTYDIVYFEYGSIYLSNALDKRYGKLRELFDDLWLILEHRKILSLRMR